MTLTEPTLIRPPEGDLETKDDLGKVSHIVKTTPPQTAAGAVLEARIMGTEIEALCGWRFVPQQDPEKLPVCQKCKEIYDLYGLMGEGLDSTPSA